MTAAIIGSPTNISFNAGTPSGTVTIGGGATHLVAAVSYADFDGTVSAISVGGNALTRLIFARNNTNNEANAEIWYWAAPTGSSLAVSVTSAATWKDFQITFYSVSGTGAPVTTNTDSHNAATNLSAAVSCAVGDMVFACAACDRAGTAFGSWANSFTGDLETGTPNTLSRAATAHKVAASTTETATITAGGSSASFSAALAVAVFPATATGSGILSRPRGMEGGMQSLSGGMR